MFIHELNVRRRAFAEILPAAFSPEKFVALVLQSFRAHPKLAKCTLDSVLMAAFQAAKLGLEPDTPSQLCYLIPYRDVATFVMGYQGAKVLASRDGRIVKVWAEHRFERDHFKLVRGTSPRIEHEPADGDRGEYMGTYAVAEYRDPLVAASFEYVDALDMIAVEAHCHGCRTDEVPGLHKKAANGDWKLAQKPWFKWRARMRGKTAIKRLCKQTIAFDEVGAQMRHAFLLDDLADSGKSQAHLLGTLPERDVPRVSQEQATDKIKDLIDIPDVPPKEIEAPVEEKRAPKSEPVKEKVEAELVGKERDAVIDEFAALATKITKEFPSLKAKVAGVAATAQEPGAKLEALQALEDAERDRLSGGLTPEEEAAMGGEG